MAASRRPSTIRAPHIGMPRWTRQAGTPVIGSAAANAASVRGASSMCHVTINGAGPSMAPAGGSAVNGTPAAVPVIVSMAPPRFEVCHPRRLNGGRDPAFATGETVPDDLADRRVGSVRSTSSSPVPSGRDVRFEPIRVHNAVRKTQPNARGALSLDRRAATEFCDQVLAA